MMPIEQDANRVVWTVEDQSLTLLESVAFPESTKIHRNSFVLIDSSGAIFLALYYQ
jgi:hypothetical protein